MVLAVGFSPNSTRRSIAAPATRPGRRLGLLTIRIMAPKLLLGLNDTVLPCRTITAPVDGGAPTSRALGWSVRRL